MQGNKMIRFDSCLLEAMPVGRSKQPFNRTWSIYHVGYIDFQRLGTQVLSEAEISSSGLKVQKLPARLGLRMPRKDNKVIASRESLLQASPNAK